MTDNTNGKDSTDKLRDFVLDRAADKLLADLRREPSNAPVIRTTITPEWRTRHLG